MLDFNLSEMAVVAVIALLVIGPKDLPKAMRVVGHWVGRARGVARQFRSGFDTMVREAELAEMEKKWAAENERIMREHPTPPAAEPSEPAADVEAERELDGESPPQMTPRP
jgi:sec-independent protein translocase protein TatB